MSDDGQPGQPDPTRPLPEPPAYPGSYGQAPPPPQWGDTPPPPQWGEPPAPPQLSKEPPPAYGQQPPPYGQPPQWGQQSQGFPPAPQGYHYAPPDDPGAQAALITGILSLALGFMCGVGFLAAPFALVMGLRSKNRIDASGGRLGGGGNAQGGFIMGIIGTAMLALAVLAIAGLIALIAVGVITSDDFSDTSTGFGTAT